MPRVGLVRFSLGPQPREQSGRDRAEAWSALIQLAGAVGGLAVLVYLVGAATQWLRFRKAGYPADVAVEHQPRSEMIALGIRGLFFVAGVLLLISLATFAVALLARLVERALPEDVAAHLARVWKWIARKSRRGVEALLVATAVIVGAFVGWRVFGVLVALSVGMWLMLPYADRPRRPSMFAVFGAMAAAGVAAVCWQITGAVRVQGVLIRPVPDSLKNRVNFGNPRNLANVAFPYFGETDSHVFVAEVSSVKLFPDGTWHFNFRNEPKVITEVDRAHIRLAFPVEKDILYDRIDPPACVVIRYVAGWTPPWLCPG